MKIALLLLTLAFTGTAKAGKYEHGTYKIDTAHSKVGFEVTHLVISSVEGRFNKVEGTLEMGKTLKDTSFDAIINVDSIDTGIKDRDDHLKSPDFFDAKKYQKILFKSKKVSAKGNRLTVLGDLTIKDTTKEVTLKGQFLGQVKDSYGNNKVAFEADGEINRKDFGLTWTKMVEAGPVVGDKVKLNLKIQASKAK